MFRKLLLAIFIFTVCFAWAFEDEDILPNRTIVTWSDHYGLYRRNPKKWRMFQLHLVDGTKKGEQ